MDAQKKNAKAVEVHMPTLGKISLAKLVTVLEDLVEDCLNGTASKNTNIGETRGQRNWYSNRSRRTGGRTKNQNAKNAEKTFSEVNGDFLISCSGAIRVYAMQRAPTADELKERKARLMKEKLQEELERKKKTIEKARREALQAEKKLVKLKKRLEDLSSD